MRRTFEIAVIGGGGFIGRSLSGMLAGRETRIRIVSRSAAGEETRNIHYFQADVSSPDSIGRAIESARVVIHMSAGGGAGWADFERDFVRGARNVAKACLESGVERLVYVSSIAALYLGDRQPVSETSGTDPHPARRSFYARAKIEAEKEIEKSRQSHALPAVILRPGIVVGRGGLLAHSGTGYWPTDICCLGWGRGLRPLPFVLVDDVASAILAAVDAPGIDGRSFNLAGDVYLSAREYVNLAGMDSRRKFQFYPQPLVKLQALEIAKWLVKVAARKPENPFPSFRDIKSRSLRAPIDNSAAKLALGWKPNASLDHFIAEAILPFGIEIQEGDLRALVPDFALPA